MDLKKQKQLIRRKVFFPTEEDVVEDSFNYVVFCANIKKFFPDFPSENYLEFYQRKKYHQYVSAYEQDSLDYLKRSTIINNSSYNFQNPNSNENYIFAAFHLGSYRTIISYLYEQGLKIVLIIDENVFIEQLDAFMNTTKNVLTNKKSDLVILNVKDRTSIFKLKQLIKLGYSMAVYLDGNTSLNAKTQDFSKGYISINFFNQKIFVKNGISKLASILNAKIIPVISCRDKDEENIINFYPEISIDDFPIKQDFLERSIEICYKYLENQTQNNPYQWECWSYIHKWFPREQVETYEKSIKKATKFNSERYAFYKVKDNDFIFDYFFL